MSERIRIVEPPIRLQLYQDDAPARISVKNALKMADAAFDVVELMPQWRFVEQHREYKRRSRLKAQEKMKEHNNANT